MGTLWSLPAGSEAPGNSFGKSSPHTKKVQLRFWVLTKTLCNLERCTGTSAYPASTRSASANRNAEKHPKLALEEIALQAKKLSLGLCSKGAEKSKRFTWATGIKQNSFVNTEQGLLKIPCFLFNTFTAKAFYKYYTGSIITKSPEG